jgi:hemerythrin superfamily protein
MTIYEILSKEHREFEQLLDRLLEASKAGDDSWKGILDELRRTVVAHAHAEEAVLYNALREANEGTDFVMHGYGEHEKAELELRTLGVAKMIDTTWTSLVEKLRKDLLHHLEEEESRIFDAARQVFYEEEATQLGAAFERMKTEMANDGDSMVESTLDLVANLLPPRLTAAFRKNLGTGRSDAS